MSVSTPNVIDLITYNESLGTLFLIMVENRSWSNFEDQMESEILDKLNYYIAVIDSRALFQKYPDADGAKQSIQLNCLFQPPKEAIGFFDKISSALQEKNIEFIWRFLPDEGL